MEAITPTALFISCWYRYILPQPLATGHKNVRQHWSRDFTQQQSKRSGSGYYSIFLIVFTPLTLSTRWRCRCKQAGRQASRQAKREKRRQKVRVALSSTKAQGPRSTLPWSVGQSQVFVPVWAILSVYLTGYRLLSPSPLSTHSTIDSYLIAEERGFFSSLTQIVKTPRSRVTDNWSC